MKYAISGKCFFQISSFLWKSSVSWFHVSSFKNSEIVVRRCSVKNMFLEISQNSQKKTCGGLYFSIKLQANCLIWVLWRAILKTIVLFLISALEFLPYSKVWLKKQSLNLGPRMLFFGICEQEFEHNFAMFEISTLEFVKLQNFA